MSRAVLAPLVGAIVVATPTAARADPSWLERLSLGAFVDGYASFNANEPRPQTPTAGAGGNQFREFDVTDGFALSWAGLDASLPAAPVGGTLSLRFGPTAAIDAGADAQYGLEYVKQALASWRPWAPVRLDFGKFDAPYGAEVPDSQLNLTYSRSLLFTYAQPLFFTGVSADWTPADALELKVLAANGWNNSVSMNQGKTAGVQLLLKPFAGGVAALGYVVGPQQAGAGPTDDLRHMGDFVLDVTAGALRLVADATLDVEGMPGGGTATWYGANLTARYEVTSAWSLAMRAEELADPQGWATGTHLSGTTLSEGTFTLGWAPDKHLLLKLEERLDTGTTDSGAFLFAKGGGNRENDQSTTTLGVVVHAE